MKDYLAGLFTNYLGLALSMAIQVFLLPFLLNNIGPEMTGLYYLFMTISHFVAVGISWLTGAGVFLLASSDTAGDAEKTRKVHQVVFLGFGTYATVILAAVFAWGATAGNWWLSEAGESVVRQGRAACWFLGLYIWVYYIHQADIAIFTATLRQGWANFYRVISQSIFVVGLFVFVIPDPKLDSLMLANLSGIAVAAITARAHLRISGVLGPFEWKKPDAGLMKKMFLTKGMPYFIFGVAQFGLIYGDVLIIGAALGPAMVSAYLVIWKIPEVAAVIIGRISEILSPYLTRIDSRDGPAGTAKVFLCTSRLQHCLGLSAGLGYAFFGPSIVTLWVGEAHTPDIGWYYWTAGAVLAIQVVNRHDVILHYALARLGKLTAAQFAELALKVGLMFLLFGKLGIAAPLVAALAIQLFGLTWFYRNSALRQAESGWSDWLRQVGSWACVAAAVSGTFLFLANRLFAPDSLASFILWFALYALVTVTTIILIERRQNEKGLFKLNEMMAGNL